LLDSLKKALAERALNAEMDHHLGTGQQAGNSRNGYGSKTVITDSGKIRDEGMVRSKAIHIALGARADGRKEVLGLWIEQNEGAKFWLRVMNELKNRGVDDIMLCGLVTVLRRSPERFKLATGDRRDDQAFRRVQAGGSAHCADQRSVA
jgi:transposase-like protein